MADSNFLSSVLNYGKSFAQGASNSIAGNVSAPVDGLAWLLRRAGVPMPSNPVGGSDWMSQQGLTPQPQVPLAGMLGESAGMAGPMIAAAKAPQLARGLLQIGENAMVPRTMNPQTGAVVWHGSPHKFDAFDSSKIGTGEGAQAYGHGLYLADNKAVAREYQEKLSSVGGARTQIAQQGSTDAALVEAERRIGHYKQMIADGGGGDMRRAQGMLSISEKNATDLRAMQAGLPENTGALYKVDLPDEHIAKMLDWDSPLSKQSPEVQAAVNGWAKNKVYGGKLRDSMSPDELLRYMSSGNKGAGEAILQQAGIPGIKYLDGGSRGVGNGSSNYVVFPKNEGLLTILERNGPKP